MPLILALTLLTQLPFDTHRVRPDGGPELLVHHYATPLVALRLSAPLPPDLPEGALELIQELSRPAAVAEADRLGARVGMSREGDHAVIRISGPARALDDLVTVLRRATAEADFGSASLVRARGRAEDRVLGGLEQPEPLLRRLLDGRLRGRAPPSGFAAGALEPDAIRALRRELFAVPGLRVVVVGNVPNEALLSAFGAWPAIGPGSAGTAPEAGPPPRPQALGPWAALGYGLDEHPAVVAVAAAMVDRRVRVSALRSGSAEAWRGPFGAVLIVLGGASPRDEFIAAASASTRLPLAEGAPPARSTTGPYLRRLIAEARTLAGPDAVAAAALDIRRALLLEARTPAGRAEAIGRFADLSSDVQAFLDALSGVGVEDVHRALDTVLASPATLVEVAP